MTTTEKYKKIEDVAWEIIRLSRDSLIINLRFMDQAVSRLCPVASPKSNMVSTDGVHIIYDPVYILESYKKGRELPVRQYLHMVLHCVFRHFNVDTLVDRKLWNLACDIAVENIINGLEIIGVSSGVRKEQDQVVGQFNGKVKYITAELLYQYFLEQNLSPEEVSELAGKFFMDDHSVWYTEKKSLLPAPEENRQSLKDLSGDWKRISEKMQVDMETFSKAKLAGSETGNFFQNLKEVNREKYDYAAFLKKFAVLGECMKMNEDEFDYIFYTYGMKMYGKMPLIEPLEYKEVKKIREFVIAIDTSGSTSGELVQKFLNKTYNIMKQQENFFSKINVHIIQCDSEIKEHVKITDQKEFDEYISSMVIRGLGGTDFRPVFSYVDQLIEQKEFTNLKGMIYFTDGYGEFPPKQPAYQTAVVYIDDEVNNPEVPVWAIKLVLRKDEV